MSRVISTIEWLISKQVNNFTPGHFNVNSILSFWDILIVRSWNLISFPSSPIFPCVRKISIVRAWIKWNPPNSSFVKLNFDGSSRGNPSDSSIGACQRNHLCQVLVFYTTPISPGTNNMVESNALLEGSILAKRMYFSYLRIEGHSSIIINSSIHRKSDNWHMSYALQWIWGLIDSLEIYLISHVYREGNALRDFLENFRCNKVILDSFSSITLLGKYPTIISIIKNESSYLFLTMGW